MNAEPVNMVSAEIASTNFVELNKNAPIYIEAFFIMSNSLFSF